MPPVSVLFQKIDFDVGAALAVVVDAGPVARKRAPADGGPRPGEHGQGRRAMFRKILAAGQQADDVHAHVGHVADEEAVLDRGAAAVQQVDRGAGRLRAVVAEDAVAEERGILHLSKVFDRYAAAAGTGVVLVDLDVLDRGIGSRVDLDAAAVGIEERRLAQIVGFDRRLVARAGREVLGAGDFEASKDGLPRHAVAEIDDVVHDGRITWRAAVGDLRIARGERDVADRLEGDAIMAGVEPDERLPAGGWAVGSGVNVDGLVDGIPGRRFERVLDPAPRMDMITGGPRVEAHAVSDRRPVLASEAADRQRARRQAEAGGRRDGRPAEWSSRLG